MSGLYVHIPFCVQKCRYCDFVSQCDMTLRGAYFNALVKEIELTAVEYGGHTFDTVFIGGGTPSVMCPGDIARLIDALKRHFDIDKSAEISMEANPGTLTYSKLKEYRSSGINRMSIGLQSTSDNVLKAIGRIHSYSEFLDSFSMVRDAGFDNVNIDIIYGLPGQTPDIYESTLNELIKLHPEHISAYSLILEDDTPLKRDVDAKKVTLPDEDEAYSMHLMTRRILTQNGYMRYEISNYAKAGRQCLHNLNYWNNGDYLGLGVNSHSAMHMPQWTRWNNTPVLSEYLSMLSRNVLARENLIQVDRKEEMFECVMLGLRKTEGMDKAMFIRRFGEAVDTVYTNAICELDRAGWLTDDTENLRLTEEGLDFQNSALMYFM